MTDTTEAPSTWHGLTEAGELLLLRLQAIADRLDAIKAERDALYEERAILIADGRLDEIPVPTQLAADFARVTDAAILHSLREEEERRGLTRGALGRGVGRKPAA